MHTLMSFNNRKTMRRKLAVLAWGVSYASVLLNDTRKAVSDRKQTKRREITDSIDLVNKV